MEEKGRRKQVDPADPGAHWVRKVQFT
jgi:hypothetical protein